MTQDARTAVTAETLFRTFFLPLYPGDVRSDLAAARATDANPARNPAVLRHLDEAADVFTRAAARLFGANAAAADLRLDYTDASIHRLSRALTRTRRDAWAATGAAGSPDNELFNVVVHGAAYVGACIVKNHGGAWKVRRPLWESLVGLSSRAGDAELAVFHWWLKSLADAVDERDDVPLTATTLADRYRTHVEIPCAPVDDLPIVVAGSRKLPRLSKIRYDVFYKYIKANLPEIRDVGEHFPSPERFDELQFKWLDFHVVGDGRMVLLVGFTSHGVHLFWLGANGFEKAALYPCDGFPEPVVRITGDKIQLLVSYEEKTVTHEMLWWGP